MSSNVVASDPTVGEKSIVLTRCAIDDKCIIIDELCVCLCACGSVTSEISEKGRCSDMLLAPIWRASPGELCRLVF